MMVASGAVSLGRTKLPTLTLAALMRPEIGARILVKSSWTLRFSSVALFDSAVARDMLTWVCALLSVTTVVAFLATSSV